MTIAGGMADGHAFKAYLPGGASGGILPSSEADVPLDFGGRLAELGSFVGSHAIVVFSDQDNIKDVTLNLIDFFTHESCGQCTPCRGGTEKMGRLLRSDGKLDEATIRDLEQVMRDASICGLGQAGPQSGQSSAAIFPERSVMLQAVATTQVDNERTVVTLWEFAPRCRNRHAYSPT